MKRIISVIAIAIIIVVAGLFAYYYFVDKTIDPTTGQKESFRQFLPFGEDTGGNSNQQTSQNNAEPASTTQQTNPNLPLPELQQVTSEPIAGSMIVEAPYASTTRIRYVDRATGNVYDFDIASGMTDRLTNTTVPKIRQTVWNPNGSGVIMRFLEDGTDFVDSYYATFDPHATTTQDITGTYLTTNINELTALGNTGKLFSIIDTDQGANGYVSDMNGANRTLVFQSPISEWMVEGIGPDTVALTTKSAGYTDGFLYFFNTKTDTMTKILGNVVGLTTLTSPDGNYVLFGEDNNGYHLNVLDVKNKTVFNTGLNTIPEKCAWNSSSTIVYCAVSNKPLDSDYLDLWHQGIVSTTDVMWAIDPVYERQWMVEDMQDKNIDGINLSVDSTGKYVSFMNKKDLTLWVLRVPQATSTASTSAQ